MYSAVDLLLHDPLSQIADLTLAPKRKKKKKKNFTFLQEACQLHSQQSIASRSTNKQPINHRQTGRQAGKNPTQPSSRQVNTILIFYFTPLPQPVKYLSTRLSDWRNYFDFHLRNYRSQAQPKDKQPWISPRTPSAWLQTQPNKLPSPRLVKMPWRLSLPKVVSLCRPRHR